MADNTLHYGDNLEILGLLAPGRCEAGGDVLHAVLAHSDAPKDSAKAHRANRGQQS